jgi:lipopolysaccharide biosynthesis glycosyltransferase
MAGLTPGGGGIAAFFRESRVQAALKGPPTPASQPLLDGFFGQFGYDDCSADQLLTLAELASRCRNQDVAAEALRHVIASGTRLPLAQYRLGRLRLVQGQHEAALGHFDAGAAANPDFPFNHMGAARARHALGLRQEAALHAERFAEFGVRPHGAEDFTVLGDLADFLFDAGQRARALPIYGLIRQFSAQRTRHVVRLAEARIAEGDEPAARAMLLDQVARTGADPWISRALAICYSLAGEHVDAVSAGWQAVQADPSNQGFVGTFVRVVGKSGDAAVIRDAITSRGDSLSPQDKVELEARLHLTEADPAAAASVLLQAAVVPESRLYFLTIEAAYAALSAGEPDLATRLWEKLRDLLPDDITAKILRIDILFRNLAWEDAGAILESIPSGPEERPQVTMKRLEYACFTADPDAAAHAAAQLQALAASGRQFMLPVFRYLAEQQDWNGVVDRALPWLDASLNYRQIGYVLFRAARHTARHAELLAAIHAMPDWVLHDGLKMLRNALAYDGVDTAAAAAALLADDAVANDPLLVEKLTTQRAVMARAEGISADDGRDGADAVFLCTDRSYLCATLVVLHGLTRQALPGRAMFFIVCDDDIVELAQRAIGAFLAAGHAIAIVPASDVTGSADRLLAGYGLFTSGHTLARAAYYRIYFAAHLRSLGHHARALYVDSDVLLTGALDDLLRLHGSVTPLTARLEDARPEVRRAIAHHGLPEGQYFNSGVLLIDLRHPDLELALQASMAAIDDPHVTLLYHDQCALNLGFRGRFTELDQAWNYPVSETTKLADIPPGVGLLHFLDRPKPWSAAYQGEAGPLWFSKWRAAAAFMGEAIAVEVFRGH